MEKGKRRYEQSVPTAYIEPGKDLLVPRWEVLQLWNEAMGFCDKVCLVNHGHVVYGETGDWDIVSELLERTSHCRVDQYGTPARNGFESDRDRGFAYTRAQECPSAESERQKSQQCSRFKLVFYCTRECQVADWKNRKPNCQPQ
jgi:ABC-type multidrug transport system ATPase subunit